MAIRKKMYSTEQTNPIFQSLRGKAVTVENVEEDLEAKYPSYMESVLYDDFVDRPIFRSMGLVVNYLFHCVAPLREQDYWLRTKSPAYDNPQVPLVRLKSFYNYRAKQYEEDSKQYLPFRLPNIYVCVHNGNQGTKSEVQHFSNIKIHKKLFMKYPSMNSVSLMPEDNLIQNRTTNVVFNQSINTPLVKTIKKEFPFGINLMYSGLPSSGNNKIKNSLIKLGLFNSLIESYIRMRIKPEQSFDLDGDSPVDLVNINFIDFIESPSFTSRPTTGGTQGPVPLVIGPTSDDSYHTSMIKVAMFKSFMRKFMQTHRRSFKDIVDNKESYSEVLFYKIEKYTPNNTVTPHQTFYFVNKSDYIDLIDTQVAVGEIYTYRVVECKIVLGNSITPLSEDPHSSSKIGLSVLNDPQVGLFEIPLFQGTKSCIVPPPLPPYADFKTEKNSHNSIKLCIYPNKGDHYAKFIPLNDSDLDQDTLMLSSYRKDNKTKFKYYDGPLSYEIYRTSDPPKNFKSFGSMPLEVINNKVINNAYYYDKVRPDEKYYYLIRAINSSNLKSNPSTIYEVQLISGIDDSVVEVKKYIFPESQSWTKTKKMQKLIQIRPSNQQTLSDIDDLTAEKYSESVMEALDDVNLGIAEKRVWGKKFKIRVTSKNTGRKIDLNVVFDIKKKKPNQDLI